MVKPLVFGIPDIQGFLGHRHAHPFDFITVETFIACFAGIDALGLEKLAQVGLEHFFYFQFNIFQVNGFKTDFPLMAWCQEDTVAQEAELGFTVFEIDLFFHFFFQDSAPFAADTGNFENVQLAELESRRSGKRFSPLI